MIFGDNTWNFFYIFCYDFSVLLCYCTWDFFPNKPLVYTSRPRNSSVSFCSIQILWNFENGI